MISGCGPEAVAQPATSPSASHESTSHLLVSDFGICVRQAQSDYVCWTTTSSRKRRLDGSAQVVTVVHTGGSFCSERTPSPACWDAFGGPSKTLTSAPPDTSAWYRSVGWECAISQEGLVCRSDGQRWTVAPWPVRSVRTSSNYACSLGPNGELTCWSPTRNDEPHSASAQVLTFGNWKALRIAAGTKFRTVEVSSSASACALSGTHVRCWGRASPGSELAPVTVGGLRPPIKIAVGGSQACSLDSSGSVRCWSIVAMEPGATIGSEEVVGLRHPTELGCGLLFCCALEGDGHAMCWGRTAEIERLSGVERVGEFARVPSR